MERTATILIALVALVAVHVFWQRWSRKAAQSLGKYVGYALRAPLRAVLTPYYRRKVIRQMQEERRKQGLPPMENPDTL